MKIEVDVDEIILTEESYNLIKKMGELAKTIEEMEFIARDNHNWNDYLADLNKSFAVLVKSSVNTIILQVTEDIEWRTQHADNLSGQSGE